MQPERGFKGALTKAFLARFKSAGAWYTYVPPGPGSRRGMPDLLFGFPARGFNVWVEAKSRNGSLSDAQRNVINDLIRGGDHVRVVQEGGSLASRTIALSDTTVTHIFAPREALKHDLFWDLLWP
jgi:hypothetical protein